MNTLKIAIPVAALLACIVAGALWFVWREPDDFGRPEDPQELTPVRAEDGDATPLAPVDIVEEEVIEVEEESVGEESAPYGSGDAPEVLIEVVDPEDEPIAGALLHWKPGESGPTLETDDEGTARIRFADYTMGGFGIAPSTAQKLFVAAEGFTTKVVWIDGFAEYRRVELTTGVALSGRVVTTTGAPVNNAVVRAVPLRPDVEEIDGVERETRTGPSGRFDLEDLSADGAFLLVEKDDFAPVQHPVTAGEMSESVEIVLDEGQHIAVHVFDAFDQPIENALLSNIYGETPKTWQNWKLPDVTTDRDGQAVVRGVPRGADELRLEVSADGFESQKHDFHPRGLTLQRSAEVRLRRKDTHNASLSGTIRDQQGQPFSGRVLLQYLLEDGASGDRHSQPAPVAPDGSFSIDKVRPGIEVAVFAHWVPSGSSTGVGPIHLRSVTALEPGEDRQIDLAVGDLRKFELRTEFDDGSPASAVRIDLSLSGGPGGQLFVAKGTTNSAGRLRILLIDGTYNLTATYGATALESRELVVDDSNTELALIIGPGADLTGVLVDEQGHGIAENWIRLILGETDYQTLTDGDGNFRFVSVPDIPVRISASGPRGTFDAIVAEDVRVGDSPVTLVLRMASLALRVQDGASETPLRAHAQLYSGNDMRWSKFQDALSHTTEDGVAVFPRVSHGQWTLHVTSPGYFEKFEKFRIEGDTELVVELERAAVIVFDGVSDMDAHRVKIEVQPKSFRRQWTPRMGTSPPMGPIHPGASRLSLQASRRTLLDNGRYRFSLIWTATLSRTLHRGENVIPWQDVLDAARMR
jgi:hypothetical protein